MVIIAYFYLILKGTVTANEDKDSEVKENGSVEVSLSVLDVNVAQKSPLPDQMFVDQPSLIAQMKLEIRGIHFNSRTQC